MMFFGVLAAVALLILTFKYPLVSIVFFLTSSLIKTELMVKFEFFQKVDLTVLAAIYVLFGMIVSLSRRPWNIKKLFNGPYLMMLLLACVLFLGLAYTSSPAYGWEKSSRYFVFGSIMFFAPIIMVSDKLGLKKIIWILLLIGVTIGVGTIAMPHAATYNIRGEGRAGFLEAGPLPTAEKIAVASLIAFYFLVFRKGKQIPKIIGAMLIPISLVAIVLTGSRGSLYAIVLCFAITPFLFSRQVSKMWLIPAAGIVVIGMLYAFTVGEAVAERSVERISTIWTPGEGIGSAMSSRLQFFSFALTKIPESPLFGHGTGAFAVDSGWPDERYYPHNTILELGYENGIIGASIFIVFIYWIYRKWKYSKNCITNILGDDELFLLSSIAGILFIFTFLQAMKSSDIDGNRFLFFCAGLIMAVFYVVTETLQQIEEDAYYDDLELQEPPILA